MEVAGLARRARPAPRPGRAGPARHGHAQLGAVDPSSAASWSGEVVLLQENAVRRAAVLSPECSSASNWGSRAARRPQLGHSHAIWSLLVHLTPDEHAPDLGLEPHPRAGQQARAHQRAQVRGHAAAPAERVPRGRPAPSQRVRRQRGRRRARGHGREREGEGLAGGLASAPRQAAWPRCRRARRFPGQTQSSLPSPARSWPPRPSACPPVNSSARSSADAASNLSPRNAASASRAHARKHRLRGRGPAQHALKAR